MAAAVKEAEAKKPTNPPKPVAKAGEVVEDPVDYKLTHSDVVIRTKDGVGLLISLRILKQLLLPV